MDVIVKVRDPEENLEEKIKTYKVKKRIKTAVTILAFVFALISSYLLVKLQTYTSLRTLQSYKNKETESSDLKYLQYADGMLKYGRDGIAYINKKGVEQWNQSYQIKDPVINVSGKAMAVAERGGNDIYVMDEKGAKGEIHTNYPIEKIAVAENGIVSTILNNENSPMVVCYDATGNVLVEHRASLTGTGYPIGIALSPNGTRLQISYLCVADGVEATRVEMPPDTKQAIPIKICHVSVGPPFSFSSNSFFVSCSATPFSLFAAGFPSPRYIHSAGGITRIAVSVVHSAEFGV